MSNKPTYTELQNKIQELKRALTHSRREEEVLREKEKKYRLIADNAGDVIFTLDMDLKYTYVSPSVQEMRGFAVEEVMNHTIVETLTPESLELASRTLGEELAKEKEAPGSPSRNIVLELEMRCKDGGTVWTEVKASFIRDKDGSPTGILGTTRNITDRKKTENALRDSEARFRQIFEGSRDGFVMVNTQGRITLANQAFCKMLGYSLDELREMENFYQVTPERWHRWEEEEIWRNRLLQKGYSGIYEKEYIRKNGKVFPVELQSYAVFDETGDISYLWGIARDITDRKKAEEALQASEQKYRKLINTAPYGIQLTDLEGRIVFSNPAYHRIQGYADGELIGKHIWDLMADEAQKTAAKAYYQRLITEQPMTKVHFNRNRTKDGREIDVQINWDYMLDSKGQIEGILSIISDISDQKQLESRLRQAQKLEAIGNLAGGIAHDFNNILFPIIGVSELLLEDLPPESSLHNNVLQILNAGKRGSALVNQILAFSRQTEHKMTSVHIQHIVKEVLKLSRSTIPSNIDIAVDVAKDCGPVLADPIQVHQITMNLITNAYHAVEQNGGTISIKLKEVELEIGDPSSEDALKPGKYAALSVSDTGCGIDPADMDKIFEPYFTTKEQGKGTGLGLAVAYGIVKEHRGRIAVTSRVEEGTTFTVYLPIFAAKSKTASTEQTGLLPTGNERILLVDDEPIVLELLQNMLGRLGYRVTSRNGSLEALECFQAKPNAFDMVITDMAMPKMTGDQLAKKIISIRPDLPIIICTGFSERMDQEKALSLGVRGFLLKPIIRSEMAKMVRNLLDSRLTGGKHEQKDGRRW